ncbi:MAG: DsbA family oxidoreductase [Alphaproteobacteria bacterium]
MHIDIVSDTICPWCLIGKRRLERALAQRPGIPVALRWHAFQLNPWMPPEGMERAAYLAAKFGSADAEATYANIARVGAAEGIPFRFDRIPRTPNTVAAHRLVRLAGRSGRQDAVVEALFQAYFVEGRDIGSIGQLAAIAGAAGLDAEAAAVWLAGDEDRDAVLAEDASARRMGVQGVPLFIVAGRYVISGAQEAEYFLPVLDLALNEETRGAAE